MHLTFLDCIPIINPVYEFCSFYLGSLDRIQLSINLVHQGAKFLLFPFENPNQTLSINFVLCLFGCSDTTFQYI